MSVFKSICADLGDNFLSTRVSFGGGFQMPKQEKTKTVTITEDKNRKTGSFKQEGPGKTDLLSSIDKEIFKLKEDSSNLGNFRVKAASDYSTDKLTSLEELEKLRIIHQEKLKVLEAEYNQKKQEKQEEIPKKSVLADYSQYKMSKNIQKHKFSHNPTYAYDEPEKADDSETLLK